ncbi:hypothetical protein QO016_001094 [Methylobacterium persicinum]|uniref:Uncharacterized protein n=1 Tax=Methylobacterium persicinum TaxID=374426 RepID=A0ABU0HJC2_9HYPH|nr:hypothetical protein [Methylobacterium persicinum]GJE39373.1 hypothetical protein KHHGKMAE_3455 [Methylobacterium persicinum]
MRWDLSKGFCGAYGKPGAGVRVRRSVADPPHRRVVSRTASRDRKNPITVMTAAAIFESPAPMGAPA